MTSKSFEKVSKSWYQNNLKRFLNNGTKRVPQLLYQNRFFDGATNRLKDWSLPK